MAIKSYNKMYLSDACENLGAMLEYGVYNGLDPVELWNKFIRSNIAEEIQRGNPSYIAGHSGSEYLCMLLNKNKINNDKVLTFNEYYWAGHSLAWLQYETNCSFSYINTYFPITRVLELYHPLHEADISKFIDVAKTYLIRPETNLKRFRTICGLSQSQLARFADVKLRSIQMYEQRHNAINKASVETVVKLSKALGCRVEDLLEL